MGLLFVRRVVRLGWGSKRISMDLDVRVATYGISPGKDNHNRCYNTAILEIVVLMEKSKLGFLLK